MSIVSLLKKIKKEKARRAVIKRFNRLSVSKYPRAPHRIEGESYPQWLKRAEEYWRAVNRFYRLFNIEEKMLNGGKKR